MEGDEYESTETVLVAARLRLRNLARQEAVKLYEKYRLQSERQSGPDAFSEVDLEDSYTKTPSLANTNRSHDNAGQDSEQDYRSRFLQQEMKLNVVSKFGDSID
jgi:hypothetical protein